MLSVFPELLFLSPFAFLLMRITTAGALGWSAWRHASDESNALKGLGFFEAVVAAALFAGFYTQPAALASAALVALWLFMPRCRVYPMSSMLLIGALSISLVVTGAGIFAIDLPL